MTLPLDILPPLAAAYLLGLAAVVGACLGSFMNCLAWRVVNGESVLHGRSHCPACGHALGVLDLVPVVSWALLRGKCRYCKTSIAVRYVAVELVMAVVFALLLWQYGASVQTLAYWALVSALCGMALVDLDTYTIPNGFILAGIGIWLASVWFIHPSPGAVGGLFATQFGTGFVPVLVDGLLGAFAIGILMLVLSLVFDKITGRTSLGGGDVKLLFMLGLFLGAVGSLFNLLLSCVIGLVLALVWGFSGSRASCEEAESSENIKTKAIPFGPAIAIAFVLTLLVGPAFLMWYLGLLL